MRRWCNAAVTVLCALALALPGAAAQEPSAVTSPEPAATASPATGDPQRTDDDDWPSATWQRWLADFVSTAERLASSLDTPPKPRQVLVCDVDDVTVNRDEWGDLDGSPTPREALDVILDEPIMIPREGYKVLERDAAAVLFGYRNGGEVKVAIRVLSRDGEGGDWIPEWLANCRLAEYGGAAMGPGVWMWTNDEGRSIHETRGSGDCGAESMRILYLTESRTGKERRRALQFVRDPAGDVREQWQAPYLRDTSLPADARFTGYRRDGAKLWIAADGKAVYIKRGKVVQQWPRVEPGVLCA